MRITFTVCIKETETQRKLTFPSTMFVKNNKLEEKELLLLLLSQLDD